MLKIGVLGVGHLGKIHLKCIQLAKETYELIGFYDPDDTNAQQAVKEYGATRFDDLNALLDAVDVVDVVTPTTTHFELASRAIRKGKHLFIEKPLTRTLEEAELLVKLSINYGVKVQVGHVERFNPALMALEGVTVNPMFIEAHRLATFNPRGTDVSVVLDLMIHDLDIILSMVPSKVKEVHASGVSVVSNTPDISNARIEFQNGCIANLTASRISMKQMRKVRLFQKDAYISLDFLDKTAQVIRLFEPGQDGLPDSGQTMELETPNGTRIIHMDMPNIEPVNAIKMELESLAESILEDVEPRVSIQDGFKALKLAYQIAEDISKREKQLS